MGVHIQKPFLFNRCLKTTDAGGHMYYVTDSFCKAIAVRSMVEQKLVHELNLPIDALDLIVKTNNRLTFF